MSNITILAQTNPKQSFSEQDTILYTQWAIQKVESQEERDNLVSLYGCREIYKYLDTYVSLRRVVRENSITGELNHREWDILDFSPNPFEAAKMGDSHYYTSKSLDVLHTRVVEWRNKYISITDKLQSLKNQITKTDRFSIAPLDKEYRDRYDKELKSRKIYSKAQKNQANPTVINDIRESLQKDYQIEYANIIFNIDALEIELEELLKQSE